MQSSKQNKASSNGSQTHSEAITEFSSLLHQSMQQIEMHVQIAQDASDIARQHAAISKTHRDEAEKQAKGFDPVAWGAIVIGISALFSVGAIAFTKQAIIQEIRQEAQSHVQIRK